jgi:hypothetical protein
MSGFIRLLPWGELGGGVGWGTTLQADGVNTIGWGTTLQADGVNKIFHFYNLFDHYGPVVHLASNINEYQEYFPRSKGGRCVGLTTLQL